ncbi:hypothetical protein ACQCSX_06390 [Pseudarthrobacter sp. P1]|uniref:hypothetical protein n=1 Tax=Pseudarthrobacter sp. P1 TaxID=3418418 RepID=UPI003CEC25A9
MLTVPGQGSEPHDGGSPPPLAPQRVCNRLRNVNARKGWVEVLAVQRNAVVSAWERLTSNPLGDDTTCHGMKGDLESVPHQGANHGRQYELSNGARIWFYVQDRTVVLVDVHTHHPNATK